MNKFNLTVFWFLCAMMLATCKMEQAKNDFVTVKDGKFYIGEERYVYAGANYWQGMHLGSEKYGDRERLKRELDQLVLYGIKNLRVMASCEADEDSKYCMHPALQTAPGVYDEDVFVGLDFLLEEMAKRDMKAIMVLNNYWTWSGGFPQYLKWAGAGDIPYSHEEVSTYWDYINYAKEFLNNPKAKAMYANHVKTVVSRKNTVNGKLYTEDPTIMSWQLANEPRGFGYKKEFLVWIDATSTLIKSMAPNQLVSTGSEGNTPSKDAGVDVEIDHAFENIDYMTMHIWAQNWSWYTPGQGQAAWDSMLVTVNNYWDAHVQASIKLSKPLVLEEFGLARDAFSYDVNAAVEERDAYYKYMYNRFVENVNTPGAVQGVNFWAYSGEGRPPRPGEYWQKGDTFIGDPPHELQGWYGVYNSDISTLEVIQEQMESCK